MTNNITLQEYNKEIQPLLHSLFKKEEILKEFSKDDVIVLGIKEKIKALNEDIKAHLEEQEPDLVREINALKTDIGEAIKAAAKVSETKPAALKSYLVARAKQKVEDTFEKAELFEKLNGELE